jgi:hypothetical protein
LRTTHKRFPQKVTRWPYYAALNKLGAQAARKVNVISSYIPEPRLAVVERRARLAEPLDRLRSRRLLQKPRLEAFAQGRE